MAVILPVARSVDIVVPAAPRHLSIVRKKGAIFIDKDGALLEDVPYNVYPARMNFAPRVAIGLHALAHLDYPLIVVSNQAGIELGQFEERLLHAVEERLREMFSSCGATMTAFRWCPHVPGADGAPVCSCRKPMPGLLADAAVEFGVDLEKSWMIGDVLDDIEAGTRAGCRTILVDNGGETGWRTGPLRTPHHVAGDFGIAARLISEAQAEL